MICNKCKIEQPEDNFQVYWHSTFNKHYRRRICKSCSYKANRKWKLKKREEELKNYKKCADCNQLLHVSNYYWITSRNKLHNICTPCQNKRDRKDVWENMDYRSNPNEWISDEQRDVVHSILRNIGWKFNEEKQIWYNLPVKDENGNWNFGDAKTKKIIKKGELRKLNIKEIAAFRSKGMKLREIASIYNVSINVIRNRLERYYSKK